MVFYHKWRDNSPILWQSAPAKSRVPWGIRGPDVPMEPGDLRRETELLRGIGLCQGRALSIPQLPKGGQTNRKLKQHTPHFLQGS